MSRMNLVTWPARVAARRGWSRHLPVSIYNGSWEGEMSAILRAAVLGLLCFGTLATGTSTSRAADYPNRPVHWLNGFAPGGPVDTIARIMEIGRAHV